MAQGIVQRSGAAVIENEPVAVGVTLRIGDTHE
jgi:hypothetical protein